MNMKRKRAGGGEGTFTSLNDGQLLEMLRIKAGELGRSPTVMDVDNDPELPNHRLYHDRFGSYRQAQIAAGLSINWKTYTREEALGLLRMKAEELGRSPTHRDLLRDERMPHSNNMWVKLFGGLNRALRLIGREPNMKYYTDNELLELLRRKAEELGRTPTRSEINDNRDMPWGGIYRDHFGSFRGALEKAGLTGRFFAALPDEELLDLLRKKADLLGRAPGRHDLDSDPTVPSWWLYQKRFGSLAMANFLIQYKAWGAARLTADIVRELIRTFHEETGVVPTIRDFQKRMGYPSSSSAMDRFHRTWNQFLTECGLPVHTRGISLAMNRKAELFVTADLVESGCVVLDMTIENGQAPYSLLVNGKFKVQVAASHPCKPRRGSERWYFKCENRECCDYLLGVGYDHDGEVEATFIFPTGEITGNRKSVVTDSTKRNINWRYYVSELYTAFQG